MSEPWEQEPLGFMQIFVVTDKDDANVKRFLFMKTFEDIILNRRRKRFIQWMSFTFFSYARQTH